MLETFRCELTDDPENVNMNIDGECLKNEDIVMF